jgi:hypothetical protein
MLKQFYLVAGNACHRDAKGTQNITQAAFDRRAISKLRFLVWQSYKHLMGIDDLLPPAACGAPACLPAPCLACQSLQAAVRLPCPGQGRLPLGVRMEMDQIRMESNSDSTFYHILNRIQIQIRIFSDTNAK